MSSELDTLSGLPNRNALSKNLRAAFETGGPVATLFLDIKDTRSLNDVYGHLAVDHLLVAFARRLKNATHVGDFVARIGGDEFMVAGRVLPASDVTRHKKTLEIGTFLRPNRGNKPT
jgi:diguanylate cyclase (GGDEF)-like protein